MKKSRIEYLPIAPYHSFPHALSWLSHPPPPLFSLPPFSLLGLEHHGFGAERGR